MKEERTPWRAEWRCAYLTMAEYILNQDALCMGYEKEKAKLHIKNVFVEIGMKYQRT